MTAKRKGSELVKYQRGVGSTNAIKDAIQQAWTEIMQDPDDRAQAEKLLGIRSGSLSSTSLTPYGVRVDSGLTGAEAFILLLLWDFAKDLGYDVVKDTTKELFVRGGKALWNGMMKKRVKAILPPQAIGKEVVLSDDVQ